MRIGNNSLLDGITYKESPNHGSFLREKKYIIMHFTGISKASSTINTFLNPVNDVSAHLLIDRDGTITQFVPFNMVAWHAGKSSWKDKKNLNDYSIGIEFVNAGELKYSNSSYSDYYGNKINSDDVQIINGKFWHNYTLDQIQKAKEVVAVLRLNYKCEDILGHSDIAPGRKTDPGPAFPWKSFK